MVKTNTTEADDIRKEFDALKSQFAELLGTIKKASESKSEQVKEKLETERDKLQEKANEKIQAAQKLGEAGLEDLSVRVQDNPIGSLLVAFGIGFVFSKIMGK